MSRSRQNRSEPRSSTSQTTVSSERSQSETISVLLLTGIIIALAATLGVVMTFNVMSQTEAGPRIDLDGEATKDTVTLEHAGGSRLDISELEVVLRGDSTDRYDLASFTQRRGADPAWFESGDRWQREHGISGDSVEVLLVHTPSGTVAGRTVLELTATGPFFEVDITDTNSPVEQGDSLETEVTVENTGIETGTQNLEFAFDGIAAGIESITLSPGASTSRVFSYDTSGVLPGTYTVEATTNNRSNQETVTVLERQANLTITAVDGVDDGTTDREYSPTVTVTESANIETDGLAIELILETRDSETTVFQETKTAPGDLREIRAESLTAGFNAGQLDANNYNYFVTASASNAVTAADSGAFVVGEPAFFNVTIEGTNSPVQAGDTAMIDATINNTGGITGTRTIELSIDGATTDSQSVTLGPGDSRTVTFEWQTQRGDQSNSPYDATVSSNDDTDSIQITVSSPGGGGGQTDPPAVETRIATGIDTSSATLNGELTGLGTANTADVYFQYRETGTSTWTETSPQTRTTTGTFSETVTGLDSETGYEFRAVAESTDGSDTSDTLTFTTTGADQQGFTTIDVTSAGQGANNNELTFAYQTADSTTGVTLFAQTSPGGTVLLDDGSAPTDTAGVTYSFGNVNMNQQDITVEMTAQDADGSSRTCSGTIANRGGGLTLASMSCS